MPCNAFGRRSPWPASSAMCTATSGTTVAARMDRCVDRCPAHAGRRDWDVSLSQRVIEFPAESCVFLCRSPTPQTPPDPVQRPDVVRMLGAALDPAAQAKVIAVHVLGFDVVTLFRQQ